MATKKKKNEGQLKHSSQYHISIFEHQLREDGQVTSLYMSCLFIIGISIWLKLELFCFCSLSEGPEGRKFGWGCGPRKKSSHQFLLFPSCPAATAKSLQSCLTLRDPIDSSPPGFPIPGILQARTLEWVAISFSNAWKWKVKVKSLSRVRL